MAQRFTNKRRFTSQLGNDPEKYVSKKYNPFERLLSSINLHSSTTIYYDGFNH